MQQHQQQQQQTSANNPYAQIVSNLSKDNPYASLMENIQQNLTPTSSTTDISKAPIIYTQNEAQPATSTSREENEVPQTIVKVSNSSLTPNRSTESVKKPLLSLAQYGSDTDDDSSTDSDEVTVKVPPGEMQVVIDKMASYVSKNGADFENIVRSKGDTRFDFLKDNHEYHGYYKKKLNECRGLGGAKTKETKNSENRASEKEHNGVPEKLKLKKVIGKFSAWLLIE